MECVGTCSKLELCLLPHRSYLVPVFVLDFVLYWIAPFGSFHWNLLGSYHTITVLLTEQTRALVIGVFWTYINGQIEEGYQLIFVWFGL